MTSQTCPHCDGKSGFEYRDYAATLVYVCEWKGSFEHVVSLHTRPVPKFGKCIDCDKRVKISDWRKI